MTPAELSDVLSSRFAESITGKTEFRGELTLTLRPDAIHAVCAFCKDELGFDLLLDISSVDHFEHEPRYEVVYELYSLAGRTHLRLKTTAVAEEPCVRTVCDLWPTANWHEREVWDMMGIKFDGHPDLRRILMWEGYPFHPLRKDFPLEGKFSDVPDVAFTEPAPLAGGPFVTASVDGTTEVREPRARRAGDAPPDRAFQAEP
ncbi:MAG: NADH-quinone oxidoreductase subunit C [Chthoniobacterales bacterium]|nr:NADH-quinone oxidoreductase subunit C [Chthoniobacterales bacterium]